MPESVRRPLVGVALGLGRFCLRWSSFVVFAAVIALLALLSTLVGPEPHAQSQEPYDWGGAVEVSPSTLTIMPGETKTYSLRLSKQPVILNRHGELCDPDAAPPPDPSEKCNKNPWWVMIRVNVPRNADDTYAGYSFVPSVGWEIKLGPDEWKKWRTVSINAPADAAGPITITHEVWANSTYCPVHEKGSVGVNVGGTTTTPPENNNNGGGNGNGNGNGNGGASVLSLSIEDATAVEGGTAGFAVTLSAASDQAVTVDYETAGGTATEGTDYSRAAGTLTFAPGDTVRNISVQTREDTLDEPDETFTVALSNPNGATLHDDTATGTIEDDDVPSLSIADAPAVEEGETARFAVRLSPASHQTVTVSYGTAGGTATEGTDYSRASGTLTFASGDTVENISVQTREDTLDEPDETFTVALSNPNGATLQDDTATGTIEDDDVPSLSIADAPAVEEGGTARFAVRLSAASELTVTVSYGTAGGTATEGTDYSRASGTLTFAPGDTEKSISVQTHEDTLDEPDETFTVALSNPNGATLQDDTATGTIEDDDVPSLSIADAPAVEEGGTASFAVTLSAASDQTVTVDYETASGTATEGTDYTRTSGTLTFAPGDTEKIIPVQTREDKLDEPDETFTVELSNANGATLQDDTATGTIEDDDVPSLSIADAPAVEEGETARFAVRLSPASHQTVTVSYGTAGGTATEGTDYSRAAGTLTFAPGDTEKTVLVPTREDTLDEADETFTVMLTGANGATLQDDTATGTIKDDDVPSLSIADAPAVEEGGTARFAVRLSPASHQTVTVDYETAGGTATESTDYSRAVGTLTFTPGDTEKTVLVATREDTLDEPDETFTVALSNPNGATLHQHTATGTIEDDDVPSLSIADASAVEEGETARFAVRLSAASDQTVTVDYETAGGTATEGADYSRASGTLIFALGDTEKTISVQTREDTLDEPDETFTVELSNANGATLHDDTATGTITDNDERPLEPINRQLIPELGRALAFTAVRCRIEQAFSDMARGWAKPAAGPSLSVASIPGGQAHGDGNSPELEEVLADTSFLFPLSGGGGSTIQFATWGCGDYRSLSGHGGGSAGAWDGQAYSMQVGADAIVGNNLLAGVSLTQSRGSLDFSGPGGDGPAGGRYDLGLTGVYPYLGLWVSPGLEIWGTFGLAGGELEVTDDAAGSSDTSSTTLTSATVGVNGRLLTRGATTLRLKGEWALALLHVSKASSLFQGAAVDLQRLRVAAEVEHEQIIPYVGVLVPWGELGLRHEGGDGETGSSLELGGGLHYRNIEQGWNAEVYGRRLVLRDDALPEEQGFGLRFRYNPEVPGFGPWVSLAQTWGEPASGVHRLWDDGANHPAAHDPSKRRLDLEVGYGFPALRGRAALTPYGAVSLEDSDTRGYRLGMRVAPGSSALLSLETERRERPAAAPDHRITLRVIARY